MFAQKKFPPRPSFRGPLFPSPFLTAVAVSIPLNFFLDARRPRTVASRPRELKRPYVYAGCSKLRLCHFFFCVCVSLRSGPCLVRPPPPSPQEGDNPFA